MQNETENFAQQVNFTCYKNLKTGHYESFFQRANHPTRPLEFGFATRFLARKSSSRRPW